ncbi:myosin regulatory light chain 12B-like [Symsagittifera roscoffensis]|uniref:myosin regulatory light chain 12B-like n=1 Tax=Symsagittifera roscoffensis TaxID=84072 RepID=UPI00307B57D1
MASKAKGGKKKVERASSNVFAMFDQKQIQEFKEAFGIIDVDKDQTISESDIAATWQSLGKNVSSSDVSSMVKEASGPISFTMFLTLFGERLSGTDPEESILNAFKLLDEEATGRISEDKMKRLLTSMGDRFSPEEVEDMFKGADSCLYDDGLDYASFVKIIKNGEEREEE